MRLAPPRHRHGPVLPGAWRIPAPLAAALAALLLLAAGVPRAAHAVVRTVTTTVTGQGTVTSAPFGITCSAVNTGCSAVFANDVNVTLVATPAAGWAFLGWTGACTGTASCLLPVSAFDQSVSAIFGPALTVVGGGTGSGSVTSSPAGIACVIVAGVATGTCTAAFPAGTVVTLLQSPGVGSAAGGCAPACALAITAGSTVVASFSGTTTPGTSAITVTGAGTGGGSVSSSPGGIACFINTGTISGTGCSASFAAGAAVTLTAIAASGSTFTGWSGACSTFVPTCTIIAGGTGVQGVTANFNAQATGLQVLTVAGAGTGSGTVTSTPAAILCTIVDGVAVADGPIGPGLPAGGCAAGFTAGAVVNLVATPRDDGSRFAGWSGACSGTSVICRVTISQATAVTATFTRAFALTVAGAVGGGTGTVTSSPSGITCALTAGTPSSTGCSAEFAPGTVVTLTATPSGAGTPGGPSTFTGWTGACTGTGTCVVTVSQSTTVRAGFAAAPSIVVRGSGSGSGRVTSSPAGISCGVENGVAQPGSLGSTCRATFAQGATVTLTAVPTIGNAFTGWSGVTCASAAPGQGQGAAVCTVTLRDSIDVSAQFAPLPAITASTTDLLTGNGLTPAERSVLDQLGNGDGSYNLGDLLALLDRTGQRLSGDVMSRLLALPADLARPLTDDRTPRARTTPRRP